MYLYTKNQSNDHHSSNFPNHTQAVERIIKIVTDASERVVGEDARNGYVIAIIERRKNY